MTNRREFGLGTTTRREHPSSTPSGLGRELTLIGRVNLRETFAMSGDAHHQRTSYR